MPARLYLALVCLCACATDTTMPDALADVDMGTDMGRADSSSRDSALPPTDAARDFGTDQEDDSTEPDTSPPEPVVQIGRCVLVDGSDCEGATEGGTFQLVGDDTDVPLVIGFQGSPMFVFAIRTRGIHPGDPELPFADDNPLVEISVADAEGELIASYRDHTGLRDAGEGWSERLSFFVVLNRPIQEGDDGAEFQVSVYVEDHVGTVLESTQMFRADEQP